MRNSKYCFRSRSLGGLLHRIGQEVLLLVGAGEGVRCHERVALLQRLKDDTDIPVRLPSVTFEVKKRKPIVMKD